MKRFFSLLLACAMSMGLLSACSFNFGGGNLKDIASSLAERVENSAAAADEDEADNNDDDAAPAAAEGKAGSYAEAYTQAMAIRDAVVVLMESLNEKHNAALADDDPNRTDLLMYSLMFMSIDMAFTATFTEDAESITGVRGALAFLGTDDATVERVAANQYRIAYVDTEGVNKEMNCAFDPATGSMEYIETEDGTPDYFFNFVNLGGNQYAYQTKYERGWVEYENGEVKRFSVSAKGSDTPYDSAADSIYPGGNGANEAWVTDAGADAYSDVYTYDGSTLHMEADGMLGGHVSADIAA